MSLSPRPLRPTRIDLFGVREGANLMAYANACDDSSAGIIPSVLHKSWNAFKASSSVTLT